MRTTEKVRRQVGNILRWHDNGICDSRDAAIQIVCTLVQNNVPFALNDLASTLPPPILTEIWEYLEQIKNKDFLLPPFEFGRFAPEEAKTLSESRRAIFSALYDVCQKLGRVILLLHAKSVIL